MTGYYDVLTKINTLLSADPFVNTVTEGDIFEVDLLKQTIFPLSHVMVNSGTVSSRVVQFNISIIFADIVDKTADITSDNFRGNDNEQDVKNTQLAVALRFLAQLERGEDTKSYQLTGNPSLEPFTERFENYLAGWVLTFDVDVPNTMTKC